MKTFINDIFPQIQNFSQNLDNLTLLTNQHWVSLDNIFNSKTVYIFRKSQELLVSTNGKIEKAKWEYLGNKYLVIEKGGESYLFKQGFIDENVIALKVDGSNEYAVFINENKYDGDLDSIDKIVAFLKNKYTVTTKITPSPVDEIDDQDKADARTILVILLLALVVTSIIIFSSL